MARLLDGTTDHTRGNYLPGEATHTCFLMKPSLGSLTARIKSVLV